MIHASCLKKRAKELLDKKIQESSKGQKKTHKPKRTNGLVKVRSAENLFNPFESIRQAICEVPDSVRHHSTLPKTSNSKIEALKQDFIHNFHILDSDKTGFLNYSRFSILLKSMLFIENPLHRTKEERELTLKAWKIVSGHDNKLAWKNNLFTFCCCLMNLYDKSLPTHKKFIGTGLIIDGIYCVRKEEVKIIHKTFGLFYENRRNAFTSTSPDNRVTLKKNLSFEDKKFCFSPQSTKEFPNLQLKSSNSTDSIKNSCSTNDKNISNRKIMQESIEEEDTEQGGALSLNALKQSKTQTTFNTNGNFNNIISNIEFQVKECESLSSSFNDNSSQNGGAQRLRVRLTTQVRQVSPQDARHHKRNSNSINRSMTIVDKNASFMHFDNMRHTEFLEDIDVAKKNVRRSVPMGFKFNIEKEKSDNHNVVLNIRLPSGVREIIVFHEDEYNQTFVDELVKKYELFGDFAADFKNKLKNFFTKNS